MNMEFVEALDDIARSKGIDMEVLLEAIEAALISAYKKNFGSLQNARVEINRLTGEIKVFARKEVVEEVKDDRMEISLTEARKISPNYEVGDVVDLEVTPRNLAG